MIDEKGYRANVGIVVVNNQQQLLWCRRVKVQDAWQFPQGGMHPGESVISAMTRELHEELGLKPEHVELMDQTTDWLYYDLPLQFQRTGQKPLCIGQKQKWCLLKLLVSDHMIRFDQGERPEFDQFRWVNYWHPLDHVIAFKREVYQKVLQQFHAAVSEIQC